MFSQLWVPQWKKSQPFWGDLFPRPPKGIFDAIGSSSRFVPKSSVCFEKIAAMPTALFKDCAKIVVQCTSWSWLDISMWHCPEARPWNSKAESVGRDLWLFLWRQAHNGTRGQAIEGLEGAKSAEECMRQVIQNCSRQECSHTVFSKGWAWGMSHKPSEKQTCGDLTLSTVCQMRAQM